MTKHRVSRCPGATTRYRLAEHDSGVISIVDDDASLRRSLKNLLSSVGFRAETFESAEAFLQSGDRESAGCLVLDLQMPGMSGLDLLSHLTGLPSRNPVIVLTAHGGDDVRERSLRAGAVAYIEKPFQSAALLDAVRRALSTLAPGEGALLGGGERVDQPPGWRSHMGSTDRSVPFDGNTLGVHHHICAFFSSLEEQHRVLRPFIKEGFDRGEKALHIVDPELRDEHLKRLGDAGIDVERTIASGQLDVRLWQDAYLREDRFDQDAMLALVEEQLQSGAVAGSQRIRLMGHMEWSLLDKPGVGDLLEYETRLNYIFPKYDQPGICTYDLTKFSASAAMDIMRTHPLVIIGGLLLENPFFVAPDQFLLEMRERRSARKSVSMAS
jgi:CheY-like chemotaxis protein